ncbi:MAG: CDP-alcohol phosphatidyltransferase family protein [Candidatus Eiseniibacteriota bacterium]
MFIEEYLKDLRRDRFAPAAALLYWRRVAAHVRAQIDAAPGTVRSIWSMALLYFAATFLFAVAMAVSGDRRLAEEFMLETALVIPFAFAFVTLHLDQLRDARGYRLSSINLPIALTLLRVILLPGLVLFMLEQRFTLALWFFLLGAISDVADGWIARRTAQTTPLGTLLDPLVDIIFNLTLFCVLAATAVVPAWVAWLALLRYGLLLVGGASLCVLVGPVRIQPTSFGRLTGVVMASLVGLLVLLHAWRGVWLQTLAPLTAVALGALLSATVVQVALLGWFNLRLMRGQSEAAGRVVGDVRWGAR